VCKLTITRFERIRANRERQSMYKSLVAALLLFCTTLSYANEKKLENESTVFNETFSWQIQMGLSGYYYDIILKDVEQVDTIDFINASLLIDFYYKGFFIQSNHRRTDTHTLGAEVGYQLIVNDEWELDIISKSYIGGFDPEFIQDDSSRDIPIIEGLDSRSIGSGVGLRYNRYFENSQLSIDVASLGLSSSVNGWLVEAFYTQLIPYRNWDIYLNSSITFYAKETMDYYFGIDPHEVTEIRPLYTAKSDIKVQLEAFFQHPITEKWTFNAGFSYSRYLGDITDSPIVDQPDASQIMLGVLYVF